MTRLLEMPEESLYSHLYLLSSPTDRERVVRGMGDERDVTRWPVDEASHLFAISFSSPFPSLSPIFDGEVSPCFNSTRLQSTLNTEMGVL